MKYEKGKEIEIDGKELYIIDIVNIEDKEYIYAQEVLDDDLTDNYFVYEINDNPRLLEDKDRLALVLKQAVENLKNEMDMGD